MKPDRHSKKYGFHAGELINGMNKMAINDSNKVVNTSPYHLYIVLLKIGLHVNDSYIYDIYDLNLKPFRGNNNINNYIFHTKKNLQFKTSNKYLLLLFIIIIIIIIIIYRLLQNHIHLNIKEI